MIGIDVSKETLDVSLADAHTRRRLWGGQFKNTAHGIKQLLDKTDPLIPWGVEPTGRYSIAVVKQGREAGRTVLLAPNRAAQLFAKSCNPRAKTDRIDSDSLSLFGLSRPLRIYPIKTEPVEKLSQLLTARKGVSDSLQRMRMQRSELPYAAEMLDTVVKTLQAQIIECDQRIQALTKSDPDFALIKTLQQVPGIGAVVATAVGNTLLSKNFAHPDSFVAYMGLDVAVRQSGKSVGRVKLTKHGDAELRRLLYMAAMSNASMKQSVFKTQYERLVAKGRSKTAALNIIARKLAHICWALHKHGGPFDASKVYRPQTELEGQTAAVSG